jgi:hypothetical protein
MTGGADGHFRRRSGGAGQAAGGVPRAVLRVAGLRGSAEGRRGLPLLRTGALRRGTAATSGVPRPHRTALGRRRLNRLGGELRLGSRLSRGPTAVDGRWTFASGCVAADVLGVGMRGTGSFDLVVRDVEVPREWTFVRGGQPTVDEPLYRYPNIAFAAQVLAVVGAGVARAALNHAEEVGAGYTGVTGAPWLADRPYYRGGRRLRGRAPLGAGVVLRAEPRGLGHRRRRRSRHRRAERPPAARGRAPGQNRVGRGGAARRSLRYRGCLRRPPAAAVVR